MRTLILALVAVTSASAQTLTDAARPGPFADAQESRDAGTVQLKGTIPLSVNGAVVRKRFVLRHPEAGWNGGLVVGAHGGSGGNNFDASGRVIGTDETALDDVIGRHALAAGFAYASVDRDGPVTAQHGLALTNQFGNLVSFELGRRLGRMPARRYLLGLSMGGGIARAAAESAGSPYAGILIVAGAGGDLTVRQSRQAKMAALWPDIDPATHPGVPDDDPRIRAFADVIGTPVAARRLWAYTATNATRAAARPPLPADADSTGRVQVPTIEVAGTWDDFVLPELKMYQQRVSPPALHRLYLVDGVWHMSGDDDGTQSFMYVASRMGLAPEVAKAMSEGPSYLPTVREAFDRLVRWVERGEVPPPSQTVNPRQPLRP